MKNTADLAWRESLDQEIYKGRGTLEELFHLFDRIWTTFPVSL